MRGKILYFPIFHDPGKPGGERSADVKEWVEKILIPEGRVTYDKEKANCYLVATGDGGMLRVARVEAENRTKKIVFGVNRGRHGLLLNPITDLTEIPRDFSEMNFVKLKLMRATFFLKSGKIKSFLAFNDVAIGHGIVDYISFKITGALIGFPNRTVEGTAVIVSTSQGTTGHLLKNKGVVYPLDSSDWHISGMATGPYPNDPVRPQRITIEVTSRRPVNGYADGHTQRAKNIVKAVIAPTNYTVTLGFLKYLDFSARRMERARAVEGGAA